MVKLIFIPISSRRFRGRVQISYICSSLFRSTFPRDLFPTCATYVCRRLHFPRDSCNTPRNLFFTESCWKLRAATADKQKTARRIFSGKNVNWRSPVSLIFATWCLRSGVFFSAATHGEYVIATQTLETRLTAGFYNIRRNDSSVLLHEYRSMNICVIDIVIRYWQCSRLRCT